MKIENSSVSMSSSHRELSYDRKEFAFMEARASSDLPSAILSISQEGFSYKESLEEYEERRESAIAERLQQNAAQSFAEMAKAMKANQKNQPVWSAEEEPMIKTLRRLLAILRGEKVKDWEAFEPSHAKGAYLSEHCGSSLNEGVKVVSSTSAQNQSASAATALQNSIAKASSGNAWHRITVASGFHTESELTTFSSTGYAKTSDGRVLDFNVQVSMTRAFTEKTDFMSVETYFKKDPLVINLENNVASVSDQKFLFDLDADGKEESISFVGEGSGFLAYDKNGDGVINDGSELFGTQNGDGFKDLAQYDADGNGWIDEKDEIFSRLRVWTKDAEGKDRLIDLKAADVGAIYLGNANTQFSLKDSASHELQAEVKKTGIFLHESSGMAGTVNHLDLVV